MMYGLAMSVHRELEVSTKPLIQQDSGFSFRTTDDAGLIRAYRELAELELTKMLIASPGNDHDFLRSIIELSHTGDRKVLDSTLQDPIYSKQGEDLSRRLKALFEHEPSKEELELVSLPRQFRIDVKRILGRQGLDFSTLEDVYARSLCKTEIPDFLNSLTGLYEPSAEFPYRRFFDIAKNSIGNQKLSFPSETAGDIYVLTFMPTWLRYVAQDVIIAETVINRLLLIEFDSDKSKEAMDKICRFLRYEALTGEHWRRLAEVSGDEDLHREIVQLRLESLSVLRDLWVDNLDVKAALIKYSEACKQLDKDMSVVYRSSSCRQWQSTDIGHGFKRFRSHDLLLSTESNYHPLGTKTGDFAVVLDDVSEQAESWCNLIDLYSSKRLLPEGKSSCEDIESLRAHIENRSVTLFLLDIQSPTNPQAGVEAAEEIIRTRFAWKGQSEPGTIPKTNIIVWSYNSDAIESAKEHLNQLITDLDPRGDDIGGIRCSSSDQWIKIDLVNKASFSVRSLLTYSRQ